jgi:aspartate aminotransferase-like enzyme
VSIIIGLDKALEQLIDEGMENVWARHRLMAAATRAGIEGMGLTTFSQAPSASATALVLPEGIDGSKLHKKLRDEYKITCAGGQDHLKGKIERIAHMGYYDQFDMLVVMGAIELAMKELGAEIKIGEGVAATQRYFAGV